MNHHAFDKYPEKRFSDIRAVQGWGAIRAWLLASCGGKGVITAECYPGANAAEIAAELKKTGAVLFNAEDCALPQQQYLDRVREFLTDDRVFGIMNTLRLEDVFSAEKCAVMRRLIARQEGLVIVYGLGASLVAQGDILVYFDMPRWEIQCRFRAGASNWHTDNAGEEFLRKFKQGFFLEWRMADRLKRRLLPQMDFVVDTVKPGQPAMVSGDGFRKALQQFAAEPFRLVPYYAPEVWGGQWMKDVCGLDRGAKNFAWAFDGVPEENSVFMRFGDVRMEFPSLDILFYCPRSLLGERVHARFGDEFPIRFDFLDTMGGQNLSLQVHPLTEYIQQTFGMHYTQDESYYILDSGEDAVVYLGLTEGIDPQAMLADLRRAQAEGADFPAARYVNTFPARKHDHFLIPAGTVHCSGKNTMVLEISATPYIFTFKLWDWGRLGLDGKPRPVHIVHGEQVIQWDRTTAWVRENLVNRFETMYGDAQYKEVRTGLHEREFIETRRCHLRGARLYQNNGSFSMCNVVDGSGAVVASPAGTFAPFTVHYAETFIIPAHVTEFELRPLEEWCTVIRAWVR